MVSLVLRKGSSIAAHVERPKTVHLMVGFINPHCERCQRTPMDIQAKPFDACERPGLLPFDVMERAQV